MMAVKSEKGSISQRSAVKFGFLSNNTWPLLAPLLEALQEAGLSRLIFIMDSVPMSTKDREIWQERTGGAFNKEISTFTSGYPTSNPNVDFYFVESHNSIETIELIKKLGINCLVNAGTPRRLSKNLLDCLKHGVINVHPGILPYYRGASAVEWSILNGDKVGHTSHFMDKNYDSGPIIQVEEYSTTYDSYQDLRVDIYRKGVRFLVNTVLKISKDKLTPADGLVQDELKAKFWEPIDNLSLSIVKQKISRSKKREKIEPPEVFKKNKSGKVNQGLGNATSSTKNYEIFISGDIVDLCVPSRHAIEADGWSGWFNNTKALQNTSHGVFPNSKDNQEEFLKSLGKDQSKIVLLICDKLSNRAFGVVSLQNIDYLSRSAEIAINIGFPSRSAVPPLASLEAMALITEHGFEQVGLKKIYGGQAYPNLKNWTKMIELIGFKVEGITRASFFRGQQVSDTVLIACHFDFYLLLKEKRGSLWPGRDEIKKIMKKQPKMGFVNIYDEMVSSLEKTHLNYLFED